MVSWFVSHGPPAFAQDQVPSGRAAAGDAESPRATDLADLPLEQLLNITVSSACKKSEKLSGAPAAIFVITAEDIRRSGFSSLPEVLRMVPGLYVAQSNAHTWAISARGFSDMNNNKMLVLIDGRSVYSPLFGGVFWDVQDLPPENVERIEVIRGPGGTLWGANAVNGVINVITKSAEQTQGTAVVVSSENDDGYTASAWYGGKLGEQLSYRLFGRSNRDQPSWTPLATNSTTPGDFPRAECGWTPSFRRATRSWWKDRVTTAAYATSPAPSTARRRPTWFPSARLTR
jgi:iron complex outermembrane receptor protein